MNEKPRPSRDARMDVDAAFDSDKRKAQDEWDQYLEGRNYQDDKGNIHNAESGVFMSNPNNESDDDYYNRMHADAESGVDTRFAGKGLKSLAEMVRDARAVGDKTSELDARAAFDDAFIAIAEKYGWEGVTDNADGTKDDRNEIADRRLAYFEKIMNGDDANSNTNNNSESSNESNETTSTATTEEERVDDGENASKEDVTNDEASEPKLTADEIRAKRKQMVQSGLRALDVGNMSDDEIGRYHLVENKPDDYLEPAHEDDAQSDLDETNESAQETSGGMDDVEVDDGGDIEEIPTAEEDEDNPHGSTVMVDTRSRTARMAARLRNVGRNLRNPGAYFGGRMNTASMSLAEARRNGNYAGRRRVIIGGAIAGAAMLAAGIWGAKKGMSLDWPFNNGSGGSGTGTGAGLADRVPSPNEGALPSSGLRGYDVSGSGGTGTGAGLADRVPSPNEGALPSSGLRGYDVNGTGSGLPELPTTEAVYVKPGDGEIRVTQTILANHGIRVDTAAAQRIGEALNIDLLQKDANYDDTASILNRIGGAAGRYQTQPGAVQALLEKASELGYK